ncbi:MAG: hypothetical protein AB7P07_10725 [Hyphomonadaceae bacterium]
MHKASFLIAAGAAALLAGCGIGAPDYPQFSETSYRIEGTAAAPDGGASVQTVIYRDGPKMRVETVLPAMGQATIVFDESTNAAYVLNPTAMPPAAPAAGAAPAGAPAGQTTVTQNPDGTTTTTTTTPPPGTTATPAAPGAAPAAASGVAVRIADADAPQPLETAWAALGEENARSTGECTVAGEDGREWQPREAQGGVERTACISDDGIVLRVSEEGRVLWEATSVQRGQQDAALFGIPPGYQVVDPEAVAEQVGETMEQLDSVTGAPNAPAQPQQTPSQPPS